MHCALVRYHALLTFFILCVVFLFFNYVFKSDCGIPSDAHPPYPNFFEWNIPILSNRYTYKGQNLNSRYDELNINFFVALQISVLGLGVLIVFRLSCLYPCTQVSYITFNTDLNLQRKKSTLSASVKCISLYMSLIMLWLLLLSECDKEQVVLLIMRTDLNVRNVGDLSGKFGKIISSVISGTLLFYIFYISVTPATCYLCQIRCHSCVKRLPHWLPIILTILSKDVHLNPGLPFQNNFFNFMSCHYSLGELSTCSSY